VTDVAAGPAPIQDLDAWLTGFQQTTVWVELGVVALCVLLAWGVSALLRRSFDMQEEPSSILFGGRLIDGVLFPLLLLTLAFVARGVLSQHVPMAVFKVAIPVLVSLVVIRLGVKVLQVAFTEAP